MQLNDKQGGTMKKEEQIAIQYNLFRWGPCLVKLKISEANRLLFLSEGKASKDSYEKRLAGILKKEVQFRDYKKFERFFSYSDLLGCIYSLPTKSSRRNG